MWRLVIGKGDGPWDESCNNHVGRQVWEFDPELGTDEERAAVERAREEFWKNRYNKRLSSDLLMRMQLEKENPCFMKQPRVTVNDIEDLTEDVIKNRLRSAVNYFSRIQATDGHWPVEFTGPLFPIPALIITLYISEKLNKILSSEHQKEIRRFLHNHQNEDGGWGFHVEGHSIMFTTVLIYVALRLLGEEADGGINRSMETARKWILDRGGAVNIPLWGKTWLSVLGVYEWAGHNPVPPELLLLPSSLPIHPGNFCCNIRLVYVGISYLYGKKFVGKVTDTNLSLRAELYTCPYNEIDWNEARKSCAKEDLRYKHTTVQDLIFNFSYWIVEPLLTTWPLSLLREKAIQFAIQYINYEDKNSYYICLTVAQKMLNMLCCWVEDPSSDAFTSHLAKVKDYLWIAEDGMKVQACGSQTWDASFAVQAILSTNLSKEYEETLVKAYRFLQQSQILKNPSDDYASWYRHTSNGGWPFSIADQAWPVSDCTGEALKSVLLLSKFSQYVICEQLPDERLFNTVNVLLSYQSKNGGFPAWEPVRTYKWVESLNTTEFFENVVSEYEYVECTSSVIQALVLFKRTYPTHRRKEIDTSIAKAIRFIEDTQKDDGSWYGRWGVCFTYAAWFAIEALVSGGRTYNNSLCIKKACKFLLSKQLESGGWGESYLSATNEIYTNLENNKSHAVNTAWAMLALIKAGEADNDPAPLHRSARFLISMQMENGDFPQQELSGMAYKTGALNYATYRNTFPIWALGEYLNHVLLPPRTSM